MGYTHCLSKYPNLDPPRSTPLLRLERCARYCLDPYPYPKHARPFQLQTVPPCLSPNDGHSTPFGKVVSTPEVSSFPPFLIAERHNSMADFFQFFAASASPSLTYEPGSRIAALPL
jgi:hypothetical protein